jgi:hypothetical protein
VCEQLEPQVIGEITNHPWGEKTMALARLSGLPSPDERARLKEKL